MEQTEYSTCTPASSAGTHAGHPTPLKVMEGYLFKQGGQVKTWKKRWFVVENGCIKYQQTRTSKVCKGAIPFGTVREIYLTDNLIQQRKYDNCCFAIACGYRTYLIVANSPMEAKQWIRYLQHEWKEAMRHAGDEPSLGSSSSTIFRPTPAPYTPASSLVPHPERPGPPPPTVPANSFYARLQTTQDATSDPPSPAAAPRPPASPRATGQWLGGLEAVGAGPQPPAVHTPITTPAAGPHHRPHYYYPTQLHEPPPPPIPVPALSPPSSSEFLWGASSPMPPPAAGGAGGGRGGRGGAGRRGGGSPWARRMWRLAAKCHTLRRQEVVREEQHTRLTESLAEEMLRLTALLDSTNAQYCALQAKSAQLQRQAEAARAPLAAAAAAAATAVPSALPAPPHTLELLPRHWFSPYRDHGEHEITWGASSSGHQAPAAAPLTAYNDAASAAGLPHQRFTPPFVESEPAWGGGSAAEAASRGGDAPSTRERDSGQKARLPVYENCTTAGYTLVGELLVSHMDTLDGVRRRIMSELHSGPRFTLAIDGKVYRDRQGGLLVRDVLGPSSTHSLVLTHY